MSYRSAITECVQRRFDELPEWLHVESPMDCVRMLRAVRLGFRDALGHDGQPCLCGGLLRPYIEHRSSLPKYHIKFGLRCDNPDCSVQIVEAWRKDQCPKCFKWATEVDRSEYPEWALKDEIAFDRLLYCRECDAYLTVRDLLEEQ